MWHWSYRKIVNVRYEKTIVQISLSGILYLACEFFDIHKRIFKSVDDNLAEEHSWVSPDVCSCLYHVSIVCGWGKEFVSKLPTWFDTQFRTNRILILLASSFNVVGNS